MLKVNKTYEWPMGERDDPKPSLYFHTYKKIDDIFLAIEWCDGELDTMSILSDDDLYIPEAKKCKVKFKTK